MILSNVFKPLSLQTCIAILASSHGDRIVRQFATRSTDILLRDRNMPLYILPLIQVVRTESNYQYLSGDQNRTSNFLRVVMYDFEKVTE